MATPIEPTPVLEGSDAEKLSRSLRDIAPSVEVERRVRAAKAFLQDLSRTKSGR